ncbi:MAG: WXG100 family type VII secretion target [Anaerolineae bacterium]|nr:WXG100 family type VII secretion target [Anaerolineae bacterium]
MTPRIQFREHEMRQAIAEFRRCAKELRACGDQMNGVANQIQQGALVGRAGTHFQTSIQRTLNPKIEELAQKLEEKARFAEIELEQMLKAAGQLR